MDSRHVAVDDYMLTRVSTRGMNIDRALWGNPEMLQKLSSL